jgi:uncharacterized membrane protein
MGMLLVASAAFLLTHLVSGTALRSRLVASIGEWPYRGLYSAVAFLTLGWTIWSYAHAPAQALLWTPLRLLPVIVMPFALILVVCGLAGNPTAVGAEKLLKDEQPARGMIRVTRHPFMWGVMLWAAAHILANGDAKSAVFFGGLLLVALFGTLSQEKRKARALGEDWQRFTAVTSHVPFVAIAQGRNRLVWREIGWLKPAIGVVLFAALFALHPWLFGARPY